MVTKNDIATEKATLMSLGIAALSAGIQQIMEGNYTGGIILVGVGFLILLVREYLKFGRWNTAHVKC